MTAVDPAALRELAQGLTVPTIAEAPPQTIAIDVDGERAVCNIVDGRHVWEDAGGYGWPDASMDGARITHVPVTVEQIAAVRAALEGAAAELERLDKARMETANDFGALECRVLELRRELEQARAERDAANAQAAKLAGEQSVDRDQITRLLDLCVEADSDLGERIAERDRARDAAAALEAENAILRPAVDEVTRARADAARATGPDPWAENEQLRAQLLAVRRDHRSVLHVDTVKAIDAVLARVDPLRAEDGGESDG